MDMEEQITHEEEEDGKNAGNLTVLSRIYLSVSNYKNGI